MGIARLLVVGSGCWPAWTCRVSNLSSAMVMDESVWFCRLRWTCADEMESSDPIVGGKPGTDDFLVTHHPRSTHKGKGK